jgi:hypothetical protein
MLKKVKLSVQAIGNESEVTYLLRDECTKTCLSQVGEEWTALTIWRMKGEHNLSGKAACNKCKITYILEGEGEGRAQSVRQGSMQQMQDHLQPGR